MKRIRFILYGILLFSYTLFASNTNTDTPVVKLLNSYVSMVNSLDKEDVTAKILDLYSDRYSGNTTYVKLSGAIIKKQYNKEDIKAQLNDIIMDGGYTFKIKLSKVLYSNQKESAGTISALLDFESFIDSKLAEKGTILLDIVAVVKNEKWVIIQNNMVRVSEAKDIGSCVCHIYEKGSTKFVTELYYPAGVSYDHKFDAFQITSNSENRIIKSGAKKFIWKNDSGDIILDNKTIGKAKDPKNAIMLLVKKANTEPCRDIIFR
ncbi:hypothetical protein N8834_00730 [bacterium]|nr:hypothetical protein [bacterium]